MEEIKIDKLHLKDVFTIIITIGSLGWFGFQRLDSRMGRLEMSLNDTRKEFREDLIESRARMDAFNKRTDRLYEMFYEVVKEKEKK